MPPPPVHTLVQHEDQGLHSLTMGGVHGAGGGSRCATGGAAGARGGMLPAVSATCARSISAFAVSSASAVD